MILISFVFLDSNYSSSTSNEQSKEQNHHVSMPDDNTELRQILVEGEPYFSKTKSALFTSNLKTKKDH